MAQDTQDFINEVKTPTVATPADFRQALSAFADAHADVMRQAEMYAKRLRAAEITEADEGLRAKMEEGFQKLRALRRLGDEGEDRLRRMLAVQRELAAWYTDTFGPAAGDAGYTL